MFKNRLYFNATDEFYQSALWKSDGTAAGTKHLRNVSFGNILGIANGKLFFNGYTYEKGNELWATNGTAIGTRLVKDIYPGAGSSYPGGGVGIDSLMYFVASDGVYGFELWKSDGTMQGTKMVKDIGFQDSSGNIYSMANGKDRLYFTLENNLWSSDDTADGTIPVNDPDLMNASQFSWLIPIKK